MKTREAMAIHRPFQGLDVLLKRKNLHLPPKPRSQPQTRPCPSETPEQAARLFAEAMADVTPLNFDCRWRISRSQAKAHAAPNKEKCWTIRALQRLIDYGEGFAVDQTSEYMEAAGPGIGPQITRRLHQGHYSVQDYVDLHGLGACEAEQVLRTFIRRAIANGRRMVLIVHGRGLTSPGEPILKNSVYDWLTQGPLRKFVIALTSARNCDGGAGATYVLLRQRPWTKRLRKIKRQPPCAPTRS